MQYNISNCLYFSYVYQSYMNEGALKTYEEEAHYVNNQMGNSCLNYQGPNQRPWWQEQGNQS